MAQLNLGIDSFENSVDLKYKLYNSLFLSLPFDQIEKTGALLTLFGQICESGYEAKKNSISIVDDFFRDNTTETSEKARLDLLCRFVQYVERQVVLFDAIEDASFNRLHDVNGIGSLHHLLKTSSRNGKTKELAKRLQEFGIRLVLTAHPTQFYPGVVLGIINDLSQAIEDNNNAQVKLLLQQLGRTPFFKKQKPTPVDEATALIWYLENVFYPATGEIVANLSQKLGKDMPDISGLVTMGFWSGGDRDGNPFVTVETTREVSKLLRRAILRCYHGDLRLLRRRLTFAGVEEPLFELEDQVYQNAFRDANDLTKKDILTALESIHSIISTRHHGLFGEMVLGLIQKVRMFGLAVASLDIRQDSSVHNAVCEALASQGVLPNDYSTMDVSQKLAALETIEATVTPDQFEEPLIKDTLEVIRETATIQNRNGEDSCERYIISHSQTEVDVMQVYGMFLASGAKKGAVPIDIAPLFETVEDLQNSANAMRGLYSNKTYRGHLGSRGNKQTIMVGFSDGTKDGGYLMANYGIYAAKKELTAVSREFGIDVIFFDGRGGPPARGGGKTHRFYASMGSDVSNKAFEVTVQGQTVSSNFGTIEAAKYNMEQLIHAGTYGPIHFDASPTFTDEEEKLLASLAKDSFDYYCEFKEDPEFIDYLEHATPLKYYARTNIGSRPAKRGGKDAKLTLDSLRAIPFVGSWSQMKQNVPGFYGVGKALEIAEAAGRLSEVTELYHSNGFFKALIDNCEMAMQKTFLPLTSHLEDDERYGRIWKKIQKEYERSGRLLKIVTGNDEFMDDFPVAKESVSLREHIVQPLTTIQQYALNQIRHGDPELKDAYEKVVFRCSFGIINAGRNSA